MTLDVHVKWSMTLGASDVCVPWKCVRLGGLRACKRLGGVEVFVEGVHAKWGMAYECEAGYVCM